MGYESVTFAVGVSVNTGLKPCVIHFYTRFAAPVDFHTFAFPRIQPDIELSVFNRSLPYEPLSYFNEKPLCDSEKETN